MPRRSPDPKLYCPKCKKPVKAIASPMGFSCARCLTLLAIRGPLSGPPPYKLVPCYAGVPVLWLDAGRDRPATNANEQGTPNPEPDRRLRVAPVNALAAERKTP